MMRMRKGVPPIGPANARAVAVLLCMAGHVLHVPSMH